MDTSSFLPQKVDRSDGGNCLLFCYQGYIQVTYVEPYFDDWEMKHRKTVFDRSFNICKLVLIAHYLLLHCWTQVGLCSAHLTLPVVRHMVKWMSSTCSRQFLPLLSLSLMSRGVVVSSKLTRFVRVCVCALAHLHTHTTDSPDSP